MLTGRKREPPQAAGAWSDWDTLALRETVLVETMTAAVDGRSSDRTRADAWAWIDSDDEEHPFGFRACAKALGADPEELRAMFRRQAARHSPGAHRNH